MHRTVDVVRQYHLNPAHMSDFVIVRSYGSDLEAELARAVLEASGIMAVVRRGDAAGILRAVQAADLLVSEAEAAEAVALLDGPDGSNGGDDSGEGAD